LVVGGGGGGVGVGGVGGGGSGAKRLVVCHNFTVFVSPLVLCPHICIATPQDGQ